MFRLIAIDFSQKSPYFSLLSPTSPCELSEREVTSPTNLKVEGALDNYSLVFEIYLNFFGQLKD
jgi:alcohol dehydrogenase YqhD (iron-dependent ADH family)